MGGAQGRAHGAISLRCACAIWLMGQLPFMRLIILLRGRHVRGVMKPAIPAWGHLAGLRLIRINHPTALKAQNRVNFAPAGAIIEIAELIMSDQLPLQPCVETRIDRLAIPPSEDLGKPAHSGSHPL